MRLGRWKAGRREGRVVEDNTRWVGAFILALGVLAAPLAVHAQQAGKVPRIGFLGVTSESGFGDRLGAFRQGPRDLGYVEGENLVIEFSWAEGHYDRLPALGELAA